MRHPSGIEPMQPLTHLWERHREIMRRLVAGERPTEIAHALGFTTSRMSIIMNSPAFKNELARLSRSADEKAADISGRIKESSIKAMNLLERILIPDSAEARETHINQKIKVAQDMLNRAGHSPILRAQVQHAHAVVTADDIMKLRQRRDSLQAMPQQVVREA